MSGAVPSAAGHLFGMSFERGLRTSGSQRSGLYRLGAAALILAGLTLLPGGAQSSARIAAREAVSRPHVYLMRGLLNIFSLGMDQLAAQIERHGIEAGVYNHTSEGVVVEQIAQMYRAGDHGPYILVGHSLGADAVMTMAQQLNGQGVPVALVIPFDGTGSYAATRNVACVLNLTQRSYAYMRAGAGFHGMLSNVDVSNDAAIDHFTIDKSPRLQAEALRYVLQAAHSETCRPDGAGPVEARPKETPAPKAIAPAKTASPGLRPGVTG
jgi:pimeloyl-ACP methyl ester carboxylesterase